MTIRPGVNVSLRSTPPARSAPTETGMWFVTGIAEAGPITPVLIRSISDYQRVYGSRVSYGILYDALDVYFREGGSRAYVSRVVGPAAANATHNLMTGATVSLIVTSIGPGTFYNSIDVGVRAGSGSGTFVIFVQDADNVEVETSPDLADQNAAVLWSAGSDYIRITLGVGTSDPDVAAAAALSGGDDDHANIVDTQWQTALDRFSDNYGIGQVSAPGRSTSTAHTSLLAHAVAHRRVALLDAPDSPTMGTLTSAASAARVGNQRFGAMFWPWEVAPGVIAGTTRSIPPCSRVAGRISLNDALGLGPNAPAAGDNGVASYTYDLSQASKTDSERETLNSAGINVSRIMFGSLVTYGWRTLVDGVVDPDWTSLGHPRLYMAIAGNAAAIGESFIFEKIDGTGRLIAEFNGALAGMLQGYYNTGDLYGDSAADAFFVDTGPQVNTPTTLANNELHAVLNVRMSPFAEMVAIEIYKKPITEGVTA